MLYATFDTSAILHCSELRQTPRTSPDGSDATNGQNSNSLQYRKQWILYADNQGVKLLDPTSGSRLVRNFFGECGERFTHARPFEGAANVKSGSRKVINRPRDVATHARGNDRIVDQNRAVVRIDRKLGRLVRSMVVCMLLSGVFCGSEKYCPTRRESPSSGRQANTQSRAAAQNSRDQGGCLAPAGTVAAGQSGRRSPRGRRHSAAPCSASGGARRSSRSLIEVLDDELALADAQFEELVASDPMVMRECVAVEVDRSLRGAAVAGVRVREA
jgi:hypothetical protein